MILSASWYDVLETHKTEHWCFFCYLIFSCDKQLKKWWCHFVCVFACLSPYFFLAVNTRTLQHLHFARLALCKTCTLQDLHFAQSGNTQIWRISPNLEKLQIWKLGDFSKFGEIAIFQSCFWEGKKVLHML